MLLRSDFRQATWRCRGKSVNQFGMLCRSGEPFASLMSPCLSLSALSGNAKERFTEPMDKLRWAEGIVDLFGQESKVSAEYTELAAQMTSATHRARLEASRNARLARKLY